MQESMGACATKTDVGNNYKCTWECKVLVKASLPLFNASPNWQHNYCKHKASSGLQPCSPRAAPIPLHSYAIAFSHCQNTHPHWRLLKQTFLHNLSKNSFHHTTTKRSPQLRCGWANSTNANHSNPLNSSAAPATTVACSRNPIPA